MPLSGSYTILEPLQREGGSRFYRGYRNRDHLPVIIKVAPPGPTLPWSAERLRHEYELGRYAGAAAVVHPLELDTQDGLPALVLEDFDGRTLDQLISAPMKVEQFLEIAIAITAALAGIHREGIVHKDIKPQNILLNPTTGEVRITDFGLASLLPREQPTVRSPRRIEGTLAYMSPEQTGRMNQRPDSRSDLYSLGVTFYQMLTGRLPFRAVDPLEWVHCHVARTPMTPARIRPGLPEALSHIVMTLLAKVSDERYQSATGLQHDLEHCLTQWKSTGTICPFALRQQDVSGRLLIPQRFYDREKELAELNDAFGRVTSTGTPELVTISGYAGVGKSSLFNELHPAIVRARALLAPGKFEHIKRDVPYSALVQACGELVKDILSEGEARIAYWHRRLQESLSPNGKLVVDLIPQIELIVGAQPAVEELPPLETWHRLQLVLWAFINAFAGPGHPLVLFLDDLHWADAASLELLEYVITHPNTRHLLVVGAYRDSEVSPAHPAVRMIEAIRQRGARVHGIELSPLSPQPVEALIAAAVRRSESEVRPLASLVIEKTAGNPFFVLQFLWELYDRRLLTFDLSTRAFVWDIEAIEKMGYTDNVIDLMVGKIRRLPKLTQAVLQEAACIGSIVDAQTLEVVGERSVDETHAALWQAVREGLLLKLDGNYRFLHDRVQQAAFALIPDAERARMHLRIGRLLLSHADPAELEARVFDIVSHLNLATELITDPLERERLAGLNLLAARRARATAAYVPAVSYLVTGISLLRADCWQSQYELAYPLHLAHAWCALLTGDFESAERLAGELTRHARHRLQLAEVHRLEIDLYYMRADLERSIGSVLAGLRVFGLEFPLHPSVEEIRRITLELQGELSGKPIESLLELPPMLDPDTRAVMEILSAGLAPAYYLDPRLSDRLTCEMVRLSLHQGNATTSPEGYASFGVLLGKMLGAFQESYRFGQLALTLCEKSGVRSNLAHVAHIAGIFINHRLEPYRKVLRLFQTALKAAMESGDLPYACVASFQLVTYRLAAGDRQDYVAAEAEKRLEFVRHVRQDVVHACIDILYQLVQQLRGQRPASPLELPSGGGGSGARSLLPIVEFYRCLYTAQLHVIFGNAPEAVTAALAARELLTAVEGQMEVAEHAFFTGLALAAHYGAVTEDRQQEYLTMMRALEADLRARAAIGSANQRSRHALVAAELARLTGDELEAMRSYERAIRWAREDGFVQVEALSYETAARFYRDRGYDPFADAYLNEARARYAAWGAEAKVIQLDRLNPRPLEQRTLTPPPSVDLETQQLDLRAILKASQTISRETVQDRLVSTLLETVLEQSGARRGCLLLPDGERLTIEAEAVVEGTGVTVRLLSSAPMDGSPLVPESIIRYVLRTGERVLLDEADLSSRFASDGYLVRVKPKSLLCLAIRLRPGEVCLLYLENDLVSGVFTVERLVALELIAAQAAISLENARLFNQAQEAIRVRDVFIQMASHELRTPLTSLQLRLETLIRQLQSPKGAPLTSSQILNRVQSAEQQTRRLGTLIRTLLDISQLDQGSLHLQLEEVDLCEVVKDTVARFEEELRRGGSSVTLSVECPALVYGDRVRLEQMVSNLLSNAIKFGGERPISIQLVATPEELRLSVHDDGIGISPIDLERIFVKFERAVSDRHYGGLGLGLYITRQLAEVHGGSVSVSSESGKGSTFTVRLPSSQPM